MQTTELFNELAVKAAAKLLQSGLTTIDMEEPPGHFITTGSTPHGFIEIASFDYDYDGEAVRFTVYMQNGG